jgi:membrane fusion protein (multidrug efflux system)
MNKISTLIFVAACFAHQGCRSEEHKHHQVAKYLVTKALVKDTDITAQYVCQIRSVQHIELRALERGYLQGVYVDEGESVKKGQAMFQIMPLVYKAELHKAEAEAEFTKIEYQNTKLLLDSKVVSPNELALAKAKLNKAEAEVELAKVHLSLTSIKAPFDGITDRFHVRLGSLLEEGEILTTLSDNSKVWAYFNVTESDYLNFGLHSKDDSLMTVKLFMANNTLFEYPGKVETVEADFNNETGNIAFRATFPNPKGLLRHGETGKVLMTVPLKGALLIPQKATFEILDKRYVFVVDENNTIKSRLITVAHEVPNLYVIKGGLAANDTILLDGLRKVRDGDQIVKDYKDPADVIAHLSLPAE